MLTCHAVAIWQPRTWPQRCRRCFKSEPANYQFTQLLFQAAPQQLQIQKGSSAAAAVSVQASKFQHQPFKPAKEQPCSLHEEPLLERLVRVLDLFSAALHVGGGPRHVALQGVERATLLLRGTRLGRKKDASTTETCGVVGKY